MFLSKMSETLALRAQHPLVRPVLKAQNNEAELGFAQAYQS